MAQDFLGSIAQEDVQFITQILKTTTPGDNFWKLMVFIEESRFVADQTAFIQIPGTTYNVATVTSDSYASVTNGLLRSWLFDFFVSGTISEVYLVQAAPDIAGDTAVFIAGMEDAYDKLKAYAYFKTVCAGTDDAIAPDIALALAGKCMDDAQLLSSAPLLPYTTLTPENPSSDSLYSAFATNAKYDGIFTAHQDSTRNGSLFRLGQALAFFNRSGTPVGNNMDYIATGLINASGEVGTSLPLSVRNMLKDINISFFKPVGDGTGNVAAVGVNTMLGNNIQAFWIVAYINFMSKVTVANYITRPNTLRNSSTYSNILNILRRFLVLFSPSGTQRLVGITISAPSFDELPPAKGDEIIIPDAWSAVYTDQVRTVRVFGTLTIAA
jgi:hypothetical protein